MVEPILNTAFSTNIDSLNNTNKFLPKGVDSPSANGKSFANLVSQVTNEGINAGNNTEIQGTKSLNKSTDIVDVVTAVTNAEVTLETAVAIRDRIISAYQTIMRMPI
tara:strand:+ start:177 stop:497 length:321 start_codon:yes stop_codon:yes gene_type:complete